MVNKLRKEWQSLSKKHKDDLFTAKRDWLLRKLAQYDYNQAELGRAMDLASPYIYIYKLVKQFNIDIPNNAKNK